MYVEKLCRIDTTVMMPVPPPFLELLHLREGAQVSITVNGGQLVVTPSPRPRYTLNELLAQCNPSAEINSEDQEWLNGQPAGRELL